MAIARKFLRWTRGDALATVSGTLTLAGLQVGETMLVEIDHSDTIVDGESVTKGRFADNPLPSFDSAGEYVIALVLDGTDGTKFRLEIKRIATPEYTYWYGQETYSGGSPTTLVVNWTRTGVLADDAG